MVDQSELARAHARPTAPSFVTGSTKVSGNRSALTRARLRSAWLFLAPMLVVLAMVAGWPLVRTIWLGFTNANLADLSQTEFIGFENYLANYDGEWAGLLVDPEWWRAVYNTVWFSVVSASIETVLGIIVALVLNAEFRGRAIV